MPFWALGHEFHCAVIAPRATIHALRWRDRRSVCGVDVKPFGVPASHWYCPPVDLAPHVAQQAALALADHRMLCTRDERAVVDAAIVETRAEHAATTTGALTAPTGSPALTVAGDAQRALQDARTARRDAVKHLLDISDAERR